MAKKTWWALFLPAIIMLLLPVSPVLADETAAGYKTLPAKTTTDTKKVWTVTFDSELARASVNGNNIYVTTSNKTRLTSMAALSADNLKVTVTPLRAYAPGDYCLYITGAITSADGKESVVPIVFPFTVSSDTVLPPSSPSSPTSSSSYILNVDADFSSYVPAVNVQTTAEVYRIDVNNIKTQYLGNNMYSAGVFGLEEGSSILIEAYDQNGRLLQSYNYPKS